MVIDKAALKKEIKSRFPCAYKTMKHMDRYFSKRFKFEVMKHFGRRYVLSSANDRLLRRVAKEADAYVKEHKIPFRRKVLYPTSYLHVQFNRTMDFILPIALKLRGAEIVPILCNGFHTKQCPVFAGAFLDNFKHQCAEYCDHPAHTIWQDILGYKPLMLTSYRHLQDLEIARKVAEGIDYLNYREYAFDGYPIGPQAAEVVANNNNLAKVFPGHPYDYQLREHGMSAVRMLLAYERVVETVRPDVIAGSLHDHYQWSTLYHVAKRHGVSYYSHTMIEKEGCVYIGKDVDRVCEVTAAWSSFQGVSVSPEIWQKFDEIMGRKADGKGTCFDIYPRKGSREVDALKTRMDPAKPVAFFPLNTPWDNAIHNYCYVTEDKEIINLIHKTVRYFNRHPEFQLVIKAHPYEKTFKLFKFLPHTARRILEDMGEPLGSNIFFIDSDSTISIFDLYPMVDVGIVHSTRSGCELVLEGKPVILTGDNHYRGKGFTVDVNNETEFFEAIRDLLSRRESPEAVERRREVGKKYWLLYYFHGYIDLGLFRGGWTKPSELLFTGVQDFLPSRNEKLDYVCDAIMSGKPVFGDNRWPPLSL